MPANSQNMVVNKSLKNILELNIAVIFMSTSGALARYIELPVPIIIWLRALIAGILIFLFCKWKGFDLKIQKQDRGMLLLSGILMGLHWVTYFYALVLSNVAIGMISLFTFPVITSFLEPIILKSKFRKIQLLLGAMVLLGVYFLVPDFDYENDYAKALGMGIISAVFFSLRNIITKSKAGTYNGSVVMMYQLIIIAVCLSPLYWHYTDLDIIGQLPSATVLALFTTAIGHSLFLYSLKNFSVTSVSIMSCSQPIYGIIVGIILLNEFPDSSSVIGGLIILTTVLFESLWVYKNSILPVRLRKRQG